MRRMRCASLALLGCLAACGTTPPNRDSAEPVARFDPARDPYWQDPKWDLTLLDTVQSVAHDPADPKDTSAPGLHATVRFTYFEGTIEYPEIVKGTGDPQKDELLLHQVASARVTQPTAGLQLDKPHEFVLDLEMPTPFESFQSVLYAAIDAQKIYPKDAIISGAAGDTGVAFDYLDGKASGIAMTTSSDNKDLDKFAVSAVTKAKFPVAPAPYAGKALHMQVLFCYTMASAETGRVYAIKNQCPSGRNVIVVQATRMEVTTMETMRVR